MSVESAVGVVGDGPPGGSPRRRDSAVGNGDARDFAAVRRPCSGRAEDGASPEALEPKQIGRGRLGVGCRFGAADVDVRRLCVEDVQTQVKHPVFK